MDTGIWYGSYLVQNNGDGTLTALHEASAAGDLENVEEVEDNGLTLRAQGISGIGIYGREGYRLGTVHPAGCSLEELRSNRAA